MSPHHFNGIGSYAKTFVVYANGRLGDDSVTNSHGIRPVINLKASTQFTGTGTSSDPYIVI